MLSPVKVWRNQKTIHTLLGKTGTIISWTIIRVPPEGFSTLAPYPVVIVQLDDGVRITAQMVDWEEGRVSIGQRVTVVVRKACESVEDGVISYGTKVRPL